MSATTPVLPSHPSEISHEYVVLIGVGSAGLLLATICVGLRFIQQKRNWGSLWWDDWACLGALILCIALFAVSVVAATKGHAGYHIWTYSLEESEIFCQMVVATELLYTATVSLSKFSVLFLYRRIFSLMSGSNIYLHVLEFLVVGFWISSTFGVIFSFDPVYTQWKQWEPHTNINVRWFYVATGIINTIIDILILAFPQNRVWKVQISRRNRILVSVVFLMGGFVCVTSLARLSYMATYNEADLTSDLSNTYIWTVLEPITSIICSCLPILYKLFKGKDSSDSTKVASNKSGESYKRILEKNSHSSGTASIPASAKGPEVTIEPNRLYHQDQWANMEGADGVRVHQDFTLSEHYKGTGIPPREDSGP